MTARRDTGPEATAAGVECLVPARGPGRDRSIRQTDSQEEIGHGVVRLIQQVAMAEGLRFAIREGGRTVGAGRVINILK